DADEQRHLSSLLLTHMHFDHTRDIPTLGLATLSLPTSIDVYSQESTLTNVRDHLLTDIYPDLTQPLNDDPAAFAFHPIDGWETLSVGGYRIKPIPVEHPVPTVGYIIQPEGGKSLAYSGDTGGALMRFMEDPMAPELLFVDVTFPNALEWRAKISGHLTPALLKQQLTLAREAGVPIPRIVSVHRSLEHEEDILRELSEVGKELSIDIEPGYEGMVVDSI
ncbi:MAG: MBL fold metallo-hydrolase, partial [Dehalococcoidia bacterium]